MTLIKLIHLQKNLPTIKKYLDQDRDQAEDVNEKVKLVTIPIVPSHSLGRENSSKYEDVEDADPGAIVDGLVDA